MMTREQFDTVCQCAAKECAGVPDALSWVRVRIREKCKTDEDRPIPKYRVDSIMAYALSRNCVLNEILHTIDYMAEVQP